MTRSTGAIRYAARGMMEGRAAKGKGRETVEPFDPSRPNIARVWDYWLGGKDNYAADRDGQAPSLRPRTATFLGGVARKQ
jgi:S-adenosyl methyltransferase